MTPRIVALVGGSGHLGGLIANVLLDRPDVQLRLLVRQESRAKVAALEQRGAQIIEGSLVLSPQAPLPRCLSVAGEVSSFHGLVAAYEAASGKKLSIIRLGSIQGLDQRIAELVQGGPQNFLSYLPLMYYRSMLLGEGQPQKLMNHLYPHIKTTDLKAYVHQERL